MNEEESFLVFRAYLLRREFTLLDVFLWVIAAPLASGLIYYSVSAVGFHGYYGGVVYLAFLLGGVIFLPITLAFMVTASSLPRSASPYVLSTRSLSVLAGYIATVVYLFISGGLLSIGFLAFSSIGVIGDGLILGGYISGSRILAGLGEYLKNPAIAFISTLVVFTILFFAESYGRRMVKILLYASTITPLVIYLAVLLSMYPFSNSVFKSNWDKLFNNSYQAIISIALQGGVVNGSIVEPLKPVDMWSGTISLVTMAMWAYMGVEAASFIASEVKDPSRTYRRGYIAGYLLLLAIYTSTPVAITSLAGYDFLAAYSYLYHSNPVLLKSLMRVEGPLPSPSMVTVISVYTNSVFSAMLFTITAFLLYFDTLLVTWVSAVRILFTLSEDHLMPRLLSKVSRKYSVPFYSNLLIYILSVVVALLTVYIRSQPALEHAFLRYMNLGYAVFVAIIGLSLVNIPLASRSLRGWFKHMREWQLRFLGLIVFITGFLMAGFDLMWFSLRDLAVISVILTGVVASYIAVTGYMKRRGVVYEELVSRVPQM